MNYKLRHGAQYCGNRSCTYTITFCIQIESFRYLYFYFALDDQRNTGRVIQQLFAAQPESSSVDLFSILIDVIRDAVSESAPKSSGCGCSDVFQSVLDLMRFSFQNCKSKLSHLYIFNVSKLFFSFTESVMCVLVLIFVCSFEIAVVFSFAAMLLDVEHVISIIALSGIA